ncbi:hypothetical protein HYT84_03100 [Candidatus Micrarchaeota archaeon]|nr:hypothetical protein [Candidatus Micrarchaeota archaeon]
MGLFDFLGSLFGASGPYSSIVAWVKRNYGSSFKYGMSTAEVKQKLKQILDEQEKKGVNEKTLKGFEKYLQNMDYKNLVKTSD